MIIRSIEEMRSNSKCTTYIEPFTGTANVLQHLKEFDHEEINDKEKALTNLLKVIKECVDKFIATLLCCPVNEKVFEELKNESTNLSNTPKSHSEKILNAVSFFYLTCLSLYGKRGSIRKDVNDETLLKKIIVIKKISKRLKNTKITNNDAFYFLKVVLKKGEKELTKTIIYFDPPYIGTEWYYEVNEKEIKKKILKGSFHKKLRKIILDLKEKGANLAISYRATVTKNNKYGMTTEKVQKLLDDLYMNQDFFIQFQEVENEQIEILLTSEEVEGSIPYNIKIANLIEIWKLENILFDVKNKAVFLEKDGTTAPIYNEQGDILTLNEIQDILDRLYINKKYFISITGTETLKISLSKKRVKDSVPYDCNIADLIKKHVK